MAAKQRQRADVQWRLGGKENKMGERKEEDGRLLMGERWSAVGDRSLANGGAQWSSTTGWWEGMCAEEIEEGTEYGI